MGSFNKCSLSHYLILSSRLQEERPLSDNFLIADFVKCRGDEMEDLE
jgi:hypothetical protein